MRLQVHSPLCPGDYFSAATACCNLKAAFPDWEVSLTTRKKEWGQAFHELCPALTRLDQWDKRVELRPDVAHKGKDLGTLYTQDLARQLGVTIPVKHVVPLLSQIETACPLQSDKPLAVTVSGGKPDYTCKQWVVSKTRSPYVQAVIDATPEFQWVQIGAVGYVEWQPDLKNVIDLRDRTNRPADLLALVSRCRLILTPISLLAWVGATLGVPTLVIAGGRELGTSGATTLPKLPHVYLFGTSLPCAGKNGCWKARTVPFECGVDAYDVKNDSLCERPTDLQGIPTPSCMASITPELVVDQIRRIESGRIELQVIRSAPVIPPETILLTGGIGDVLALESFWDQERRQRISKVYYATRSAAPIMEVLKVILPDASHVSVWDDWSKRFCFFRKSELDKLLDPLPDDWGEVVDWSISAQFPHVAKFVGSATLTTKLAEVKVSLPSDFVVIVPTSPNDQRKRDRHFTQADWRAVHAWLNRHRLTGVILNTGTDRHTHERVIDLTGKTSICESIEILKRASGYIGVDSSLSVLASQLFKEVFFVKSTHEHLRRWRHVYYAAHPSPRIVPDMSCLNMA